MSHQNTPHGMALKVAEEVVAAAPPLGVSTWIILGHSVSEWAIVLTILYTAALFARLIWTWPKRGSGA